MAKCTCDLCRLVPIMERIAAKCTPEERAVLNDLWGRAECAEAEMVMDAMKKEKSCKSPRR